jgi:threonine aldolase
VNDALKEDFRYHVKQKGALMAKGKVLGIQFEELFRDDLFFELAKHANAMAQIIADAVGKVGYAFLTPSPHCCQLKGKIEDVHLRACS